MKTAIISLNRDKNAYNIVIEDKSFSYDVDGGDGLTDWLKSKNVTHVYDENVSAETISLDGWDIYAKICGLIANEWMAKSV